MCPMAWSTRPMDRSQVATVITTSRAERCMSARHDCPDPLRPALVTQRVVLRSRREQATATRGRRRWPSPLSWPP